MAISYQKFNIYALFPDGEWKDINKVGRNLTDEKLEKILSKKVLALSFEAWGDFEMPVIGYERLISLITREPKKRKRSPVENELHCLRYFAKTGMPLNLYGFFYNNFTWDKLTVKDYNKIPEFVSKVKDIAYNNTDGSEVLEKPWCYYADKKHKRNRALVKLCFLGDDSIQKVMSIMPEYFNFSGLKTRADRSLTDNQIPLEKVSSTSEEIK